MHLQGHSISSVCVCFSTMFVSTFDQVSDMSGYFAAAKQKQGFRTLDNICQPKTNHCFLYCSDPLSFQLGRTSYVPQGQFL
jgi:hypothetical protein